MGSSVLNEEQEPPLRWRKSTRCEAGGCVEVAPVAGGMAMRDSKDPDSPVLRFSHTGWDAFVSAIRAGEFSQPAE
jgi:hypothetical protein